jgi:4-hydroxy-tetrahydrodipicolinate synthase
MTKNQYAPETVAAAANLPNFCGIKDSSGDMVYFAELIRLLSGRPDFAVFCGPEELLVKSIGMGAHGGITGGANLWPELYVDLYRAAVNGDAAEIEPLQALVMHMSTRVYNITPAASRYLRGLKCALSITGACKNVLADPLDKYGPEDEKKIRKALVEVGRC